MAQYDISKLEFSPSPGPEPAELTIVLDNPEQMQLEGVSHEDLPGDVEVVLPGEEPTQEYWVRAGHHYLVITLNDGGGGGEKLPVTNTGYYNWGDDVAYLDIVMVKKAETGNLTTEESHQRIVSIGK